VDSEEGLSTLEKALKREKEEAALWDQEPLFGERIALPHLASSLRPLFYSGGTAFLLVDIHGGGFCFKSVLDNDAYCAYLAKTFSCAVLNADFTLSSHAPYPQQRLDILSEMASLLEKKVDLQGLPLVLVGHSSGANLAASLALSLGEKVSALVLDYPFLDLAKNPQDRLRLENTFPDWLLQDWIDLYCPSKAQRADPLVSPLRADPSALKAFPPCFIVVSEQDRLKEDGLAFASLLEKAGRPHELFLAQERHGFIERHMRNVFAAPDDPAVIYAKEVTAQSFAYVKKVLQW
jgi:acetyl esterase